MWFWVRVAGWTLCELCSRLIIVWFVACVADWLVAVVCLAVGCWLWVFICLIADLCCCASILIWFVGFDFAGWLVLLLVWWWLMFGRLCLLC